MESSELVMAMAGLGVAVGNSHVGDGREAYLLASKTWIEKMHFTMMNCPYNK